MDKKLSILNLLLLFVVAILISWIIRIWVEPDYPSHIDGSSLVGSPKSLQEFSANRKTYPQSLISKIMAQNLFRRERLEFKVNNPVAKVAKKPLVPPPEITVRGIILIQNTKIAVLEGNYFIPGSRDKPEQKAIKKKGYSINEYIGVYQIVEIEKGFVTLKGPRGATLIRYLKHQSITPIQREANLLFYKKKKKSAEQPAQKSVQTKTTERPVSNQPKVSPSEASPAPAPSRVAAPSINPATRISGAFQRQVPKPTGSISGASTSRSKPQAHVSGR